MRIIFSQIMLKTIFVTLKNHDLHKSDLTILGDFYFHETLHYAKFRKNKTLTKLCIMQSFAKIKPSRKFLNLKYISLSD